MKKVKKAGFKRLWCAIVMAGLMVGLVSAVQAYDLPYDYDCNCDYGTSYIEVEARAIPIWPERCTGSPCSC